MRYLMILMAAMSVISCSRETHEEHANAIFKISSALKKDTIIHSEYVSQIHAFQHIELRVLEKGYLQKVLVDEGQHVKKGQLLFQIQPTIYEAEVRKAESELEFAQIEYGNIKALSDKDIVSKSELALAKAKLEKAKAELMLSKAHLSFTEVRAPFDGIIGKFENVRLGSLLDEGELLTTLSDNSKMWVYFNIPEAIYLNYAMSKKDSNEHVHLKLANNMVYQKEGIIETIESDFNNKTGNIAFRATFPNPSGLLRHGQTGTILWPKPLKDAIMIPQKATFEVLEKKFVFLVDKEGKIQSREIKLEDELNHVYIIREGLNPGEHFLLEGLRKVQSGQSIRTEYIAPEKVFQNLAIHAE